MLVMFGRKQIVYIAIVLATLILHPTVMAMSSLSQNDPYPMFTSLDPHNFLYTHHKQVLKGFPTDTEYEERFNMNFSPFGQSACVAGDYCGKPIPIGDLGGRWGMIPLMFGAVPTGQTLAPALTAAQNFFYPGVPLPISDSMAVDPEQSFGFFSVPICHYRKTGLRLEINAQIIGDLGLKIQTGLADIMQTATFTNLSTEPDPDDPGASFDPNNPLYTLNNVNTELMSELKVIAKEIGLDLNNFHRFSVEDVRAMLYLRHAFAVNRANSDWPAFLFTPFLELEGSIAAGYCRPKNHPFALSFGSNGHNALCINSGFDIDFTESIEFGGEIGFTHFFPKSFSNMPVPTSTFQSGIYPYQTDVTIQPGMNVQLGAKIAAYRFLDRLSFYFQYMLIEHKQDRICLKTPDPAFMPNLLEGKSYWKVHLANIGFTYDIAPAMSLGFLWQAPLKQYNAYKSTTILFSLIFTL